MNAAKWCALLILLFPFSNADWAADSQAPDNLALPIGPLQFTAGPQSDGALGATLKGGLTDQLTEPFGATDACNADPLRNSSQISLCHQFYVAMTFNVDAAWTSKVNGGSSGSNTNGSASNNNNNATLTFNPSLYFLLGQQNLRETQMEMGQSKSCEEAIHNQGDKVPPIPKACWDVLARSPPFHHYLAISAYPDLEYRYGTFVTNGTTYTANQFVYGAGIRLFYPARLNSIFANWPYVSISYTGASNYGTSALPIPASIQNHYLQLNERAEFNWNVKVPWPKHKESRELGILLLVDLTQSHPTSQIGQGHNGWQNARTLQLIFDMGNSSGLKPAITLRSGQNRGLTYDRQVIFGFLWNIWNSRP